MLKYGFSNIIKDEKFMRDKKQIINPKQFIDIYILKKTELEGEEEGIMFSHLQSCYV